MTRLRREKGRGVLVVRLFRLAESLQIKRASYYDLAEEWQVSTRTIMRDLDLLRQVGFDVRADYDEADKRRAYVRIVGRFSEVA